MSCKNLGFFLLVFTLLLSFEKINAQQTQLPSPSEGFKLFFEKVYLHFDRTYYTSGDDIWFKAYLVNAQNNIPLNTSNNLYVELIDPDASIISRKVIRIDSTGTGDFQLDDSIATGIYHIRAYTNWMRNFGDRFIFEKEIHITNISGVNKSDAALKKPVSENKKISSSVHKIKFLPEGGTMIEDVPVVVSFIAEDANGKGTEASGSIVSANGAIVVKFKTIHLGMGSFRFTPKAGNQYKAVVQYANAKDVEEAFPAALPNGFIMNVTGADTANIVVTISSNAATKALYPSGVMTIAGRHAGKSYFKQQVNLKDGEAVITVPKKDFPPGIAYITLYDDKMRPHCERLVFIENTMPLSITVSADRSTYHPKEKTTINILVTDAQKRPVKAALSMAVVDEGVIPMPRGDILSYLILESDLAGKIENPAAYFDKDNNERLQQLDLLLRTQGWRSFLWRQMADTSIRISYLPEQGITISGKVTKPFSNKPLDNMNITLFAPGAKGNKIYMSKTNAAGKYYLDGLPLYGNQTIKLNTGDLGKRIGAIVMDTMFSNTPAIAIKPVYKIDSSALSVFEKEAAKRWSKFRNNQWFNILPEVTVKNKRGTTILRDGSAAFNFGYPEYNFNITSKDYVYQNLRDFIVQKVPGALYDEELEGINFLQNGKRVRPVIIVNNQQDVFDRLDYYSLSMQQISNVSVRHLVGSPTYNSGGENTGEDDGSLSAARGIRDFFLINLQINRGNADQQLSKLTVDVTGYYESRIFYSPNYSADDKSREDNRITVHWKPIIKTDEEGKATVSFYNADPKSRVRVNVEGLATNGTPVVATTIYEVK